MSASRPALLPFFFPVGVGACRSPHLRPVQAVPCPRPVVTGLEPQHCCSRCRSLLAAPPTYPPILCPVLFLWPLPFSPPTLHIKRTILTKHLESRFSFPTTSRSPRITRSLLPCRLLIRLISSCRPYLFILNRQPSPAGRDSPPTEEIAPSRRSTVTVTTPVNCPTTLAQLFTRRRRPLAFTIHFDQARTIAADSDRGLIPLIPKPWRLPCAGISPTMSLARRPRPSWSACLSLLVDSCSDMILGKLLNRPCQQTPGFASRPPGLPRPKLGMRQACRSQGTPYTA